MKKYVALVVVVITLAGGAFFTQQWFVETYSKQSTSETSRATSVTFTATTTNTVLETMRSLSAGRALSFSGRDFPGLGFFVEEINDQKNTNGYYWILAVDGKKSELGVSSAIVHPGDVVEWRYEKGY